MADFYVNLNDKIHGPFDGEQLEGMCRNGQLKEDSKVRSGDEGEWYSAGVVLEAYFSSPDINKREAQKSSGSLQWSYVKKGVFGFGDTDLVELDEAKFLRRIWLGEVDLDTRVSSSTRTKNKLCELKDVPLLHNVFVQGQWHRQQDTQARKEREQKQKQQAAIEAERERVAREQHRLEQAALKQKKLEEKRERQVQRERGEREKREWKKKRKDEERTAILTRKRQGLDASAREKLLAGDANTQWFVQTESQECGPYSCGHLTEMAGTGKITPKTFIRTSDSTHWVEAYKLFGASFFFGGLPAKGVTPNEGTREKVCPYCGETILYHAKKCKHCGEFVDAQLRKAQSEAKWSPGIAALLNFVLPGAGYMYMGQVANGITTFIGMLFLYWLCFVFAGNVVATRQQIGSSPEDFLLWVVWVLGLLAVTLTAHISGVIHPTVIANPQYKRRYYIWIIVVYVLIVGVMIGLTALIAL